MVYKSYLEVSICINNTENMHISGIEERMIFSPHAAVLVAFTCTCYLEAMQSKRNNFDTYWKWNEVYVVRDKFCIFVGYLKRLKRG